MTLLIIHPNITIRNLALIEKVNQLIGTQYSQISQLYKNPDIHILEQPEHVSLKIDMVKQLQKEMYYKPFEFSKQIAIIFHSQNLTIEAQNALLKTLEEQSEETVFILLVNNDKNLLPTIVSRSLKVYPELADHPMADEDLERIEKDGKDEDLNEKDQEVKKVLDVPELIEMPISKQFLLIEQIVDQEKNFPGEIKRLLFELTSFFKRELGDAIQESNMLELQQTRDILFKLEEARIRLDANVNKKLLLENLLMQIAHINGKI